MQQWEYCYTIKGYVMFCTPKGDRTVLMDECVETGEKVSVPAEACIVARLGLQGWEAFAVDQHSRLWFKRPKQD
jgi:hypothetical protein